MVRTTKKMFTSNVWLDVQFSMVFEDDNDIKKFLVNQVQSNCKARMLKGHDVNNNC